MGRKRRRDQPMGRKCSRYSWHRSRRWLRPNRQAMKRSDLASKKKESDEKRNELTLKTGAVRYRLTSSNRIKQL